MKSRLKLWTKLATLAVLVLIGLGSVLAPLVFTADVVAAALRILELVARLS